MPRKLSKPRLFLIDGREYNLPDDGMIFIHVGNKQIVIDANTVPGKVWVRVWSWDEAKDQEIGGEPVGELFLETED